MKIGVMLRHLFDKGGITVYTRNLLDHLIPLASAHEFVLLLPPGEDAAPYPYAGLPNVRLHPLAGRSKVAWDQWAVPRAARELKLDLVFNPKLSIPLRAPCKTVLTMHGLEQFAARQCFRKLDRLYYEFAMPLFCRQADAVICMTETGRRDIQKYLRCPPQKIHVIPESFNERCAVIADPARRAAARSRHQLPEHYVLFVGGITPLKNVPTLLRAFAQLKQGGAPHKLVLVGFKRWNFAADLALIDTLGLRAHVVEAGFVGDDDIVDYYNLATCLVMPAFYEGFGIPILEAQASGCPVIVSTGGAPVEVAGPGGALAFDPHDAAALAACLARLVQEPELGAHLRAAGLANARQFRWERTARQTLAMFEGLVRA